MSLPLQQRYWHPSSTLVNLLNDFLPDPEHSFSRHLNNDVQPFSALIDSPCVVILGEPGMGKTSEIKRHLQGDASYKIVDLSQYGTATAHKLIEHLSNHFARFEILALDGLDECTLLNEFAVLLAASLEKVGKPKARLWLA